MRQAYVAGPMSGLPDHNYPAFDAAREYLAVTCGVRVVSPADLGRAADIGDSLEPGDAAWQAHLRQDLAGLLTCDAIVLLEGWRRSKGARLEARVAAAVGLAFFEIYGVHSPAPYLIAIDPPVFEDRCPT